MVFLASRSPMAALRTQPQAPVCFADKKAKITFTIRKKVSYGQSLGLVGSKQDLGKWDPSRSLELSWSDGHEWKCQAELPVG